MRKAMATFVIVLLAVVELGLRFTHPEMTETRLFLEFWWVHLIVSGVGLASVVVLHV